MKNSLAGAIAASSLFLSATAANAQDRVEAQDFERIEACLKTIKHPTAVSAQEAPTPRLQITMNGQSENTKCGVEMSGKQAGNDTQDVAIKIFAAVANDKPSVYELRNTASDIAYDVQSNGVHYKATPIAGTDKYAMEIAIPTAMLTEESDMDALNAEVEKGNAVVDTKGDMTHITVASGHISDWMPEEITANAIVMLFGAFEVSQRIDAKEIDVAAKKSIATSSTVWMPVQQP